MDDPVTDLVAVTIRADLNAGDAGYRAAGEKFIAQKAALAHGEWLPWLRANGFQERSASRYMRYASHLRETDSSVRFTDWLQPVWDENPGGKVRQPLGKNVWRQAVAAVKAGLTEGTVGLRHIKQLQKLEPLNAEQRATRAEIAQLQREICKDLKEHEESMKQK